MRLTRSSDEYFSYKKIVALLRLHVWIIRQCSSFTVHLRFLFILRSWRLWMHTLIPRLQKSFPYGPNRGISFFTSHVAFPDLEVFLLSLSGGGCALLCICDSLFKWIHFESREIYLRYCIWQSTFNLKGVKVIRHGSKRLRWLIGKSVSIGTELKHRGMVARGWVDTLAEQGSIGKVLRYGCMTLCCQTIARRFHRPWLSQTTPRL